MPAFYPRCACALSVIAAGARVQLMVRIRRASLERNDHLHADELEIEAEWNDTGIDPRFVRDCVVTFWVDVGETVEPTQVEMMKFKPDFIGIARSVERHASESGMSVSIKAQDMTCLFIACKPFPSDGVPRYTDTLLDAWKRVCDSTGARDINTGKIVSTVVALRNRLEIRGGINPGLVLGSAVPRRIAAAGGGGPIPVKPNSDSWTVWQQCCTNLGLVSFIEGDKCIVTTTADLFDETGLRPPIMTWGSNILEFRESVRTMENAKGVILYSFDPTTGNTIEAAYPLEGSPLLPRQRAAAKTGKGEPDQVEAADWDYQAYPGVSDVNVLQQVAQLVYQQRVRQELEGSLSTAEFQAGGDLDLLQISAGDSLRVVVDPEFIGGVFSSLSPTAQVQYLIDRGYDPTLALLIVTTAKDRIALGFTFKVKTVRIELEASGDGGRFRIDIGYWNSVVLQP